MTDKKICPVCSGENTRTFIKGGSPEIMRCGTCGFMFASPYYLQYNRKCQGCSHTCFDPGPGSRSYYSQCGKRARLSVEARRLAHIEKLCGPLKGMRVLEVGAGAGYMASLAIQAGADYEGLEPEKNLADKSASAFPETRGKIRPFFPQEAGLKEKSYDLVIAADFLQYVPWPTGFAGSLAALLKDGGRLYLEVPNERLLCVRNFIRRALGLYAGRTHPGNINFFSPSSLDRVLAGGGFSAIVSGQLTLIGDPARLEATFNKPPGIIVRTAAAAVAGAGLDLLLQQGSLYRLCAARSGTDAGN